MEKDDPLAINFDYPRPKPLFEFVGRLDTPSGANNDNHRKILKNSHNRTLPDHQHHDHHGHHGHHPVIHHDEEEDLHLDNTVDLKNSKTKHSDFFFKLHELKERIDVYNKIFRDKVPRFLRTETSKVNSYLA